MLINPTKINIMKKMKTKYLLTICVILVTQLVATAQVKIGDNPTTINSSSLLEMESSNKGLLIPRMTTAQRDAIASPATGLEIYNTSTGLFNYYDGSVWVAIETEVRDNYILVKSVADFPTAAGGIITLDADVLYEINGSIVISDMIDLNGAIVAGQDGFGDQLIYVGSSELFTGSKGGTVRNLFLMASTAGAQVFNLSDVGQTQSILIKDNIFYGCKKAGTIEGYQNAYFYSNGYSLNDDGWTLDGIGHLLMNNQFYFMDNKGTMVNLVDNSTFKFIQIFGGMFHTSSMNSSTGLDFGTGVTVTYGGHLETNFHGDGTLTTGTPGKEWEINSIGIDTQSDNVATGDFYVTTSATTAISAVNTPVKIAGTTTAVNLFRVTAPTDNRLTYTGTKTRAFKFTCSLSLTAAANNKTFNFYLAKNGSVLPESKQVTKIASGSDVRGLSLSGIVELSINDYIEVWIENTTDNTNVTVEALNLAIL